MHFAFLCWAGGCAFFLYANAVLMRVVYPDPVILKGRDEGSVWVQVQSMQWGLVALVATVALFHITAMLLWIYSQKAPRNASRNNTRNGAAQTIVSPTDEGPKPNVAGRQEFRL